MVNALTFNHSQRARAGTRAEDSVWSLTGPDGLVVFRLSDHAATGDYDTAVITINTWNPPSTAAGDPDEATALHKRWDAADRDDKVISEYLHDLYAKAVTGPPAPRAVPPAAFSDQ